MKLNPEQLIKARGLSGLTQLEVAERSGLSRTSLASYEASISSPRKPTIYRLAQELGVTAEFLCERDNGDEIVVEALDLETCDFKGSEGAMEAIHADMERRGITSVKEWVQDAVQAGLDKYEKQKAPKN